MTEEYSLAGSYNDKVRYALQEEIDRLIKQIEIKKEHIDKLNQQITNRERRRKDFQEQYDRYVADLDHKLHRLKQERSTLLHKIDALHTDPTLALEDTDGEPPQQQKDDDVEAKKPNVEKPARFSPEVRSEGKSLMKKHFASACAGAFTRITPDPEDNEFLKAANTIIDNSLDEVEALIKIEWDKKRWTKRGPRESPGDQWERLTAWNVYLDIALNRLEDDMAQLHQNDQLTFWIEMERAKTEGRNYFEDLVRDRRREILVQEKAVQSLYEEYAQMHREALEALAQGDS
jgi:hypothetical protein